MTPLAPGSNETIGAPIFHDFYPGPDADHSSPNTNFGPGTDAGHSSPNTNFSIGTDADRGCVVPWRSAAAQAVRDAAGDEDAGG